MEKKSQVYALSTRCTRFDLKVENLIPFIVLLVLRLNVNGSFNSIQCKKACVIQYLSIGGLDLAHCFSDKKVRCCGQIQTAGQYTYSSGK